MRVAVTGASGLIGSALTRSLVADGNDVLRLVRREPSRPDEVRWDPTAGTIDLEQLAGVEAIVHLAGAGLGDQRWTPAYKQEIRHSRTAGTATIAAAAAALDPMPRVLLSGSAIGYYGDTGEREVDESAPQGAGFLADVVADWESAAQAATDAGVRTVHLRTGVVMAAGGGTLGGSVAAFGLHIPVLMLFRAGFGGRLGSGRQWMSWISMADQVAATRFLMENESVSGPVNLTAPVPARNVDWVKAVGRALHRPTILPVPGFALRAALGEFAGEGALISQRVMPRQLTEAGFTFAHTDIATAVEAALS